MGLFDAREQHWQRLVSKYLPNVAPDPSPWRSSRSLPIGTQGWKIHVSATVVNACDILERVAPYLIAHCIHFKAPKSLHVLSTINIGINDLITQVGKCITIYPGDDVSTFTCLAERMAELTRGYAAPKCLFENLVRIGSPVSYRYGSYGSLKLRNQDGEEVDGIKNLSGDIVLDRRDLVGVPEWLRDPFHDRIRKRKTYSLLDENIIVLQARSQRGKGGVYSALLLGRDHVKPCILKQGRRNGEVDARDYDARQRLANETMFLQTLDNCGVRVPSVLSTFRCGGDLFTALAAIPGIDCFELITKRGRLTLSETFWIVVQLMPLLESLACLGVAWRDLKPHNLLLCSESSTIYAIDFEGVYHFGGKKFHWSSPGYSASEVQDGSATTTSDIFSLGKAMIHFLSGEIPNTYDESKAVLASLQLPQTTSVLIHRSICHKSRARPTLREFQTLLTSAIDELDEPLNVPKIL